MIIWLASYPKSGNTLLRSFLCTYFFSKDNIFDFNLLKNIKQYPKDILFSRLGVDINNVKDVAKNHIKVQEFINQNKKSFQFLKTHFGLVTMDGHSFTNLENTLGAIYIVRDPRDVVLSYAHHNNQSINEIAKKIKGNYMQVITDKHKVPIYTGSWSFNYNSWKILKKYNRYLLIKYEHLINDKNKFFKKILIFIKHLTKMNFEINDNKISKIIDAIDFEKLKKLEIKHGFSEAQTDNVGNKINFFRKGQSNQWKSELNKSIRIDIEKAFEKEMKELGYI